MTCRLEAYERNCNFVGPVIDLPNQVLIDWPVSGFRQLTEPTRNQLPRISEDHIRSYFVLQMACDNIQTDNMKALEKGRLLLESLRIQACSVLDNDGLFFTGIVKAAMKKGVYVLHFYIYYLGDLRLFVSG